MLQRPNEMNGPSNGENFFANEKAFQQYYREHRGRLFRFTNQIVRNQEVAKDIVSEVFVNSWHLQNSFGTVKNLDAYIYVSCRNKAYNYLKYGSGFKNKKEIAVEDLDALQQEIPVDDQLLRDLAYKEHLEEVTRVLKTLPEKRREVIRLSFFEHLDTDEIAKILHITPENVRVTKSQAIAQLRGILESFLVFAVAILLFF